MDEKPNKYEHLPIPSYEEATSSRPTSSQSRVGPEEISDDAERQGLLNQHNDREGSRRSNYEPPTVESERSSLDSLDGLEHEEESDEVRREMQEMDMEDPLDNHGSQRSLLGVRFNRFAKFTNSFTYLSLPSFGRFIPSIRWPKIDWETMDANRVVIVGRLVGVLLIAGFMYLVIVSDVLSLGRARMHGGRMIDPELVRGYIQDAFADRSYIKSHMEHITRFPHIAGSEGSYVLGEWIAETFKTHGMESVGMFKYEIYMNYPINGGRSVVLGDWTATLEEDKEKTPVFHGHSRSGTVTGPLIYANFGSLEDFQTLKDHGIELTDAIVLVRHYGTQGDPALKVKAAQEAGAAGCIIYSDPAQDGSVQGPEFPSGRYMPTNGVQRGSVSMISRVVGDPLSPDWASLPNDKHRFEPNESIGLNSIPSLPISWDDASHLLAQISNHGKLMEGNWTGAPDTQYWSGDQSSPVVTLKNEQEEEHFQPIYNIVGSITGWEQPQKRIIVGNHRDSWCLGAASPGSGTALMLMLVRIFGDLRDMGWRPLRTIEFVSWDAGEFNAAGSTEYVEEYIDEIRRHGIAYINVDAGVTGIDFHAAASPVYENALRRILHRVSDPYSNKTVREVWEEHNIGITPLAAEGDCTPFQFLSGTSSIDLKYRGAHYPHNSCYDNYEWMNKFGEPNGAYDYAAALGQIWALLIFELADAPLLPFDMIAYHKVLRKYVDEIQAELEAQKVDASTAANVDFASLSIEPLRRAVDFIGSQVDTVNAFDRKWHDMVYGSGGYETSTMTIKRVDRNNRLSNFESSLLDLPSPDAKGGATGAAVGNAGGLPERSQYKHVVTAPKWWDSRTSESFPGIRYWITKQDWKQVRDAIDRVSDILTYAGRELGVS